MDSTTSKAVHAGISENRAASSVELARPDRDDATQKRANPLGGHFERYHSDCQPQLLKQTVPRKRPNRLNFQQVIKGTNLYTVRLLWSVWPTTSCELPVVEQFLAADITAVGALKGAEDAA